MHHISVCIAITAVLNTQKSQYSVVAVLSRAFSGKFNVENGVSKGSVLFPIVFNVYVNELSESLHKSGIGGSMNGTIINHMLYADDICIISLSSAGLQQLLNICSGYSELHDLTFNVKKVNVYVFQHQYE